MDTWTQTFSDTAQKHAPITEKVKKEKRETIWRRKFVGKRRTEKEKEKNVWRRKVLPWQDKQREQTRKYRVLYFCNA